MTVQITADYASLTRSKVIYGAQHVQMWLEYAHLVLQLSPTIKIMILVIVPILPSFGPQLQIPVTQLQQLQ